MSQNTAVLVTALPELVLPDHVAAAIVQAATKTKHRLYIVLYSSLFAPETIHHTGFWDEVQRLLTTTYVKATKVAQDLDRILMDVDVLLKAPSDVYSLSVDTVYTIDGDDAGKYLPASLSEVPRRSLPGVSIPQVPRESHFEKSYAQPSEYPVAVLGGTFDHLHAGHKILLSMAAWITKTKLIVGLTDDALLQKKVNRHVLESFPRRKERVSAFLSLFKPTIKQDIVPINDVYGPTGWDPNIQALVVSKETLNGAESIAKHRKSHDLPELRLFVIDVISSTSHSLSDADAELLKQTKMSSTFIRDWIVANLDKVPTDSV